MSAFIRPRRLADPDPRTFSREGCQALRDRILAMTTSEGYTNLVIQRTWQGNLRWARNVVTTGGDTEETQVDVMRAIRGAAGQAITNAMDDATLRETVRRAENFCLIAREQTDDFVDKPPSIHPHSQPTLWYDRTVAVDAVARGKIAVATIEPAAAANALSAGYLRVTAQAASVVSSYHGLFRYYPYTTAEFSLTVRDSRGKGSGWAGVDWNDWARIDTTALAAIAQDKCRRSRNPIAVEPGRYTAILEPQAVCDLVAPLLDDAMRRRDAESGAGPFAAGNNSSKIGQKIVDERVSIIADPMDPDCGFVPFDRAGEPYERTAWIENGILKALEYDRGYGLQQLGIDAAKSNSKAFRMTGGNVTLDEMIAQTKRGIYVTRFSSIGTIDFRSMLLYGNTRDGLWLVEHGKISKPIKNFRIAESPLFILNKIDALGVPQRVYRPSAPAVVPSLLVRDFSFAGLTDAV